MKNRNQMPVCPYCGSRSELITGDVLYPHRPDLHDKYFYRCKPCDAYCGCHPGTKNPLGRPANKGLRMARMAAHRAFDVIWKSGRMKRTDAYALLASRLNISPERCHIGMFDIEQCRDTMKVCKNFGEQDK